MKNKLKSFFKALAPYALMSMALFLVLKTDIALAQNTLGTEVDPFQFLKDELPDNLQVDVTKSGEELAIDFVLNLIRIAKFLIGGVALIFGILYALNLVFARGREEVINKQKQNFLWLATGFIILLVSDQFAAIFNPERATAEEFIDFKATNDQLRDITSYLTWLFGSISILMMTISGFRLITASGEEEVINKEKKHITWSGIGLLTILLANNIVNAIYVTNQDTGEFEGVASTQTAAAEIAGVIRLLLVFLGPIAVLFTIYAGFTYLTAFDNEERQSKARRLIVAGVTGIIIVYSAFAIVNTFISGL